MLKSSLITKHYRTCPTTKFKAKRPQRKLKMMINYKRVGAGQCKHNRIYDAHVNGSSHKADESQTEEFQLSRDDHKLTEFFYFIFR